MPAASSAPNRIRPYTMSPEPKPFQLKRRQRSRRSAMPDVSNTRGSLPGQLATLVDAQRLRVREHHAGMRVELGNHAREPPRIPAIVIADPRKVFGLRIFAAGDLGDFLPGRHHALALGVPPVPHAGIPPLVLPRDRFRLVARSIVEHHQREVAVRLAKDRIGRLAEVPGVVVERHAEHGARGHRRRHWWRAPSSSLRPPFNHATGPLVPSA